MSRSVGFFGAVTVTWQAEPREATILDFTPSSGTLNLADTQDHASFYITVIDDIIPENMEVGIKLQPKSSKDSCENGVDIFM